MDEQLKVGDRIRHATDGRVGSVVGVDLGPEREATDPDAKYTVAWDGLILREGLLARNDLQRLD